MMKGLCLPDWTAKMLDTIPGAVGLAVMYKLLALPKSGRWVGALVTVLLL